MSFSSNPLEPSDSLHLHIIWPRSVSNICVWFSKVDESYLWFVTLLVIIPLLSILSVEGHDDFQGGFYWGQHVKRGDFFLIKFPGPENITTFTIRSGNLIHPNYSFLDTILGTFIWAKCWKMVLLKEQTFFDNVGTRKKIYKEVMYIIKVYYYVPLPRLCKY